MHNRSGEYDPHVVGNEIQEDQVEPSIVDGIAPIRGKLDKRVEDGFGESHQRSAECSELAASGSTEMLDNSEFPMSSLSISFMSTISAMMGWNSWFFGRIDYEVCLWC
jgi:hypothetical protein